MATTHEETTDSLATAPERQAAAPDPLGVTPTRTGAAWTGVAVGAVLVLLMLVFVLQNTQRARMQFLWMHFTVPLGAGLLLAGIVGALIVVVLGVARMLQVRLAARRHRRSHQAVTAAG